MKLMVLDGNSIVNRAFFGVRMLNAPDGTPTNAIFGFLNIFARLMNEEKPDAVCVTFDLHAPTFRHKQYELYKAQRKGMPEELAAQMPVLKEVLDAMNVRRYELEGWEADDLIGTITRVCDERGWDSVIVTGDRDSFQLIDGNTSVKHIKTRMGQTEVKLYDEAAFRDEYGFDPPRIVDLKALMGDSSDNIPGVPGVGEKTAMDLIQRYGSLDGVYRDVDALDVKDGVKNKLRAGRESAVMSYELATIRCTAPIDFTPEANLVAPVDNDALWTVFKRLGLRRFIESYGLTPPKQGGAPAEGKVFTGECVSCEVEDAATLARMKAAIAAAPVAVAFAPDRSLLAAEPAEGEPAEAYLIRETSPVWREAMEALCAPEVQKLGHDVKDTMHWLLDQGFGTGGWQFDSALAGYLLDPTASGYEIDRLTEQYCGFVPAAGEPDGGQMSLLAEDVQTLAHVTSEAAALFCLEETLTPLLRERGLERVYREIELPLCPVLADMEKAGFLVDREALAAFGEALSARIGELQERIWTLAGGEFNINSPKQLGEVLFEKLLLPAPKKTKTGWSTSADVLEKLRPKHEIIGLILQYRELAKLKSTYTDGLLKVIGPDGRIHTSFQMTVTATGRLSSTEPNLQNIPVRRELGGEVRKMFVAPEGKVLVDADYSQIELRLLAHISGDETMREAFLSGYDIHRATAAQVFGVPYDEVTPQMRSSCKAVNFGIVYGISAFSLADDIGVPVREAKAYIDRYLERYHGVREYMENVVKEAKEQGYAATAYGRRRPLPELAASNFAVRSFGERVARNMPIQGTAADVMKLAMIRVFSALRRECPAAKLILQVHDELIVECPAADADRAAAILKREMESAASFSVPLTADTGVGKSWYEAK